MKKIHKIISFIILISITLICYILDTKITETASQNLVTFFSVVFGFYMTCIAILYSASYTKKLYKELDPNDKTKRKIDTLKRYFLTSGYWSILSITAIIIYTLFSKKVDGSLSFGFESISNLNVNLLINGIILGISAVNIFYMLLLLHTILDGIIEEAKNDTK